MSVSEAKEMLSRYMDECAIYGERVAKRRHEQRLQFARIIEENSKACSPDRATHEDQ